MIKKTLITGAAGYIGSHAVRALRDQGRFVIALDDFSTGNRWALSPDIPLYEGDFSDQALLTKIHREHSFDSVIHFAAKTSVEESVKNPALYYYENTAKTLRLLKICVDLSIKNFIYSSTCAVYGTPKEISVEGVSERFQINPESPYGSSKYFSERIIQDILGLSDIGFSILRYFNVAGAHPDGTLGAVNLKVKSLVTVAAQVAAGTNKKIIINGDDYKTRDGTCERDYIHVLDLALAHHEVLCRLEKGGSSEVFNCGYGRAYSVNDIISTMEKVSGRKIHQEIGPRRPGDLENIFSDSRKIRCETSWSPRYDDILEICRSTYLWEASRVAFKVGTSTLKR